MLLWALTWAVLRLLGPESGGFLYDRPELADAAVDPAALEELRRVRILVPKSSSRDEGEEEEGEEDGEEGEGEMVVEAAEAPALSAEARDAALRILSIGLKRCPPRWEEGELATVREIAALSTPWYFGAADGTHAAAWAQLADKGGLESRDLSKAMYFEEG